MDQQPAPSNRFLQTLIDYLPLALFVKDGKEATFGQLQLVNKRCEEIFGLDADEVTGKTGWDLFPEEDAQFYEQKDREAFVKGIPEVIPCDPIDSHKLGKRILHTIKVPLFDGNHQPEYLLCISLDVTERHQAEQALRESEQRFRALLENSNEIIIILDENLKIQYLSPSFRRILKFSPEELLGKNFEIIFDPKQLVGEKQEESLEAFLQNSVEAPKYSQSSVEFKAQTERGETLTLEAMVTNTIYGLTEQGIILNCHDITDRKKIEEESRYKALHDSLTGLPNRVLLTERLEQALKRQSRYPEKLFAVLFLDLNRFKVINDSFDHFFGDELLKALAHRLENCKRSSDTVCRLGGDEFVILLEELTSDETATQVAMRIHQALEEPFIIDDNELYVSTSIGIAISHPNNYSNAEPLLRDADTAMYKAKAAGNGSSSHAIFEPSMHQETLRTLQLENDLRKAISNNYLIVYFQPIISLQTNRLEGIEALVRWKHPEKGLISPEEFIPIAKDTGRIALLDQWVLENACQQLRHWQKQFSALSELSLHVNLSEQFFAQKDFIGKIEKLLTENDLSGKSLKLEITESVLLADQNKTIKILKQLAKLNIDCCLDDFGTGVASLFALFEFPISFVKIDHSLVKNLKESQSKRSLVRTIISLSEESGGTIIAEGIETNYQQDLLKGLNCRFGQGYLFFPPMDGESITQNLFSKLTKGCQLP